MNTDWHSDTHLIGRCTALRVVSVRCGAVVITAAPSRFSHSKWRYHRSVAGTLSQGRSY